MTDTDATTTASRATELHRLHTAPELLQLVNVWDVVSAEAVAALPATRALATASHSIASTFGYPDGEQIPRDLMLDMVARITASTALPVTADLEAGYDDAGETTRRAIAAGVVGANIEDELKPLSEAAAVMAAVVAAGESEGVDFVLNARTDAFLRGGDRPLDVIVADAIERGRAYLDAGAACVFVPGNFDEDVIVQLVEAFGVRKLSVIGLPKIPAPTRLAELGVARISYGPFAQRVALTALQDVAIDIYAGGAIPESTRPLN